MISTQHVGNPSKIAHDMVSVNQAGEELEGTTVETDGTRRVIIDQGTGQELWRCPCKAAPW